MKQPAALSQCSQNIQMKDKLSPLLCPSLPLPCLLSPPFVILSVQRSHTLFLNLPLRPPFRECCLLPSPNPPLHIISLISPPLLSPSQSTRGWFPSSFSSLSPSNLTSTHSPTRLPLLLSPPPPFPSPLSLAGIRALHPSPPLSHTYSVFAGKGIVQGKRNYIVYLPVKELFSSGISIKEVLPFHLQYNSTK